MMHLLLVHRSRFLRLLVSLPPISTSPDVLQKTTLRRSPLILTSSSMDLMLTLLMISNSPTMKSTLSLHLPQALSVSIPSSRMKSMLPSLISIPLSLTHCQLKRDKEDLPSLNSCRTQLPIRSLSPLRSQKILASLTKSLLPLECLVRTSSMELKTLAPFVPRVTPRLSSLSRMQMELSTGLPRPGRLSSLITTPMFQRETRELMSRLLTNSHGSRLPLSSVKSHVPSLNSSPSTTASCQSATFGKETSLSWKVVNTSMDLPSLILAPPTVKLTAFSITLRLISTHSA